MIIEALEGLIGVDPEFDADYTPLIEHIRRTGRLDLDTGLGRSAYTRPEPIYTVWASLNPYRQQPVIPHKFRVEIDRSRILIEEPC